MIYLTRFYSFHQESQSKPLTPEPAYLSGSKKSQTPFSGKKSSPLTPLLSVKSKTESDLKSPMVSPAPTTIFTPFSGTKKKGMMDVGGRLGGWGCPATPSPPASPCSIMQDANNSDTDSGNHTFFAVVVKVLKNQSTYIHMCPKSVLTQPLSLTTQFLSKYC